MQNNPHTPKSLELWLDTVNTDVIEHAKNMGLLHGVTTNPSILAKNSRPPQRVISELLDTFEGPLAVQVTTHDSNKMVEEARSLSEVSDRIIVKIPCMQNGYVAMKELQNTEVKVMATGIYHLRQYFVASSLGASYAAVYFNRMIEKLSISIADAVALVKQMQNSTASTKVLAAALNSPEQVDYLMQHDITCMTLPESVYRIWMNDITHTVDDTQVFLDEWQEKFFSVSWAL